MQVVKNLLITSVCILMKNVAFSQVDSCRYNLFKSALSTQRDNYISVVYIDSNNVKHNFTGMNKWFFDIIHKNTGFTLEQYESLMLQKYMANSPLTYKEVGKIVMYETQYYPFADSIAKTKEDFIKIFFPDGVSFNLKFQENYTDIVFRAFFYGLLIRVHDGWTYIYHKSDCFN